MRRLALIAGVLLAAASAAIAAAPVTDEFNDSSINAMWTFTDGGSGGACAATPTEGPGQLSIAIPAGCPHDPYPPNASASARLLQTITNVDFTVEVKIDSIPSEAYSGGGIMVWESDSSFIRFDFDAAGNGNSGRFLFAGRVTGGSIVNVRGADFLDHPWSAGENMQLRLARSGNTYTLSYQCPGAANEVYCNGTWQTWHTFTPSAALAVTKVGIFAGTSGPSPAWIQKFDYFRNIALAASGPSIASGPTQVPDPVGDGTSVQLSISASGTAPLTYQWDLDGTAIGGATSSSYSKTASLSGDGGHSYRCRVFNDFQGDGTAGNQANETATSPSVSLHINSAAVDTVYVNSAHASCPTGGNGSSASTPLCTLTPAAMTFANSGNGKTVKIAGGSTYLSPGLIDIQAAYQTWTAYDADGDGTLGKWTIDQQGGRHGAFFVARSIGGGTPPPSDHAVIENGVITNGGVAVVSGWTPSSEEAAITSNAIDTTIRNMVLAIPTQPPLASGHTGYAITIRAYGAVIENNVISGAFSGGIYLKQIGQADIPGTAHYPFWSGSSWTECPGSTLGPGPTPSTTCGAPNTYADPVTCEGASGPLHNFRGPVVRNNTIDIANTYVTNPDANNDDSGPLLFIEDCGDSRVASPPVWAIYNNSFRWNGAGVQPRALFYWRQTSDWIYVWNNYFSGGANGAANGIYLQQETPCYPKFQWSSGCTQGSNCVCQRCGTDNLYVFNNVIIDKETGVGGHDAIYWQNCITAFINNNIFLNHAALNINGALSTAGCRGYRGVSGSYAVDYGQADATRSGALRNNLFYRNVADASAIGYAALRHDGSSIGATCAGADASIGFDVMRCSNNRFDIAGDGIVPDPLLTLDPSVPAYAQLGRLSPLSFARNLGNADPEADGTDSNCSVANTAAGTASCLIDVDEQGRPQGADWEIGRDELPEGVVCPPKFCRRGGSIIKGVLFQVMAH